MEYNIWLYIYIDIDMEYYGMELSEKVWETHDTPLVLG